MRIITHPLAQKEFERQICWLKKYGYLVNSSEIFYTEIQAALDDLGKRIHHRKIFDAPSYYRIGPTPIYSYSLIYKVVGNESTCSPSQLRNGALATGRAGRFKEACARRTSFPPPECLGYDRCGDHRHGDPIPHSSKALQPPQERGRVYQIGKPGPAAPTA